MARRRAHEQAGLLDDVTRLSQFPRRKPRAPAKFDGPHNPREARFLQTILHRHITREETDAITGASNSPELVNKLRERGLSLPCYRVGAYDKDNLWTWRGLYAATPADKRAIAKGLNGALPSRQAKGTKGGKSNRGAKQ